LPDEKSKILPPIGQVRLGHLAALGAADLAALGAADLGGTRSAAAPGAAL